jgi:hypothetical protein
MGGNSVNYKEEIEYRERLLGQAYAGKKITKEERLWLLTHRLFNRITGYPYLSEDIVQLQPKVQYRVIVEIEKISYPDRIIPVISVPGGKGGIKVNSLCNIDGVPVDPSKKVKVLGLLVDANQRETEVTYESELGLLGICYQCDYYDDKMHLWKRIASDCGNELAMVREVISDKKIRYRCKSPLDPIYEFNSVFEFTVEWKTEVDE